jgi:hypothetical protein
MQVLITTGVSAATNANAIYLPYDKAPVPFGDPLAATVTSAGSGSGAAGGVFTVPGYFPANGDAVSISVAGTTGFLTSLSAITSQAQANTTYYVSSASGSTFSIATQKATAAAPPGVIAVTSTLGQNGGQVFIHLLSNQADGPTCPFKSGATVLALNGGCNQLLGTNTIANLTLFGAPDVSSILATGTYGAPLGPNGSTTTGWAVIGTIGFGAPKLLTLNYDWIVASGSTATLVLLQN